MPILTGAAERLDLIMLLCCEALGGHFSRPAQQ
jgi:hypothetical protein